ncbi:hypothetical protein [Micromonospora craterilacus]|uniref:hypothetical protein n=1 Tax=Micromonospora craterilacus TaxID=1655439 RepID=UPI0013142D3F|nr:hypothetical protein [Micromonospora craterilacus]
MQHRTNRPDRYRMPAPELPPMPWRWKVWFGIVALLGLGMLALIAWAIITLVNHFTR